jgi:hypothetical protein
MPQLIIPLLPQSRSILVTPSTNKVIYEFGTNTDFISLLPPPSPSLFKSHIHLTAPSTSFFSFEHPSAGLYIILLTLVCETKKIIRDHSENYRKLNLLFALHIIFPPFLTILTSSSIIIAQMTLTFVPYLTPPYFSFI